MSNDDAGSAPPTKKLKSDEFVPQSIKVYYFKFPFWRAEVLRAGLFLQDIPFENITELGEMKKRVPFGAFPVMEIDGKLISQTQACATCVGKLGPGKLYPDTILAQANCDEIINGCTDVTTTISATFRTPKDEVKEAREKLMDEETGRLYRHLNGLNSVVCQDGSNFACGKEHGLTVADLAVWKLFAWFAGGALDHVPKDFALEFENLKKIHDAVEANDKIIEYKQKFYPEK